MIGDGGVMLAIPDTIRPETQLLPTDDEVAGWTSAIENSWDEEGYFSSLSREALECAKNWSENSIVGGFATA